MHLDCTHMPWLPFASWRKEYVCPALDCARIEHDCKTSPDLILGLLALITTLVLIVINSMGLADYFGEDTLASINIGLAGVALLVRTDVEVLSAKKNFKKWRWMVMLIPALALTSINLAAVAGAIATRTAAGLSLGLTVIGNAQ